MPKKSTLLSLQLFARYGTYHVILDWIFDCFASLFSGAGTSSDIDFLDLNCLLGGASIIKKTYSISRKNNQRIDNQKIHL